MSNVDKQMTEEERGVWRKQMDMANILASPFVNFRNYGLDPSLRKAVERDPTYRDRSNDQDDGIITMQDLAEFMLQIAGYIFSPQEDVQKTGDESDS